jgi:polysaccharide deacetylase family protein (PEP-CTERM system associated)
VNTAPTIRNALTVDVEDYFHTEAMSTVVPRERWDEMPSRVVASTRRLFDLLAGHNVGATMFFLGWVAERFPHLVREAVERGHEIGCHSYWHRAIFRLTPTEFREDTRRAKAVIEQAGGVPVCGYRAPSFSLVPGTEWAAAILAEEGFTYDSSVNPIRHDFYNNPDAPRTPHRIARGALLELPIATIRMAGNNWPIGGGGYLRMLPYAYSRWGLRRLNKTEGCPGVIYLHPWELDPGQPRLPAPGMTGMRQYSGLKGFEARLVRLLKTFFFAPIREVFAAQTNVKQPAGGEVRAHAKAGSPMGAG